MTRRQQAKTVRLWCGVALVGLAAMTTPAVSRAQGCYATSGYLGLDLCNEPLETPYQYNAANLNAEVSVNGVSYLLWAYPNSLDLFNVGTPLSPLKLNAQALTYPQTPNPGASTHEGITDHIRRLVGLTDFPYVFAGLYTYGWDFIKLGTAPAFLNHGYYAASVMDSRYGYVSGALVRDSSGKVFLVGQTLDQTSINNRDFSARIYLVSDGRTVSPDTITYATMGQGTRIPIGGASDGAYSSFVLGTTSTLRFGTFTAGGRSYLWVLNPSAAQAVIVDVTNSSDLLTFGQPVALWTTATAPHLFDGNWAFDDTNGRLFVGTTSDAVLRVFSLAGVPAQPPQYSKDVRWWGTAPVSLTGAVGLNASADLLAVWSGQKMGYLALGGSGDPVLMQEDGSGSDVTQVNRICVGAYTTAAMMLTPFAVAGDNNRYVARSLYVYGNVLKIGAACLSTVPKPALAVSGGSAGASCGTTSGFPGDTFTIRNNSGGSWSLPVLRLSVAGTAPTVLACWSGDPSVTSVGGVTCDTTLLGGFTAPFTYTFPATPATSWPVPGQYQWDLQVKDGSGVVYDTAQATPVASQPMSICANPSAGLAVTGVQLNSTGTFITTPPFTYLTGDTVQVSAASPTFSQGTPSSYTWSVQDTSGTWGASQSGATITVPLPAAGTYTAFVAVQYGFAGVPDPVTCGNAPIMLSTTNYTSCKALSLPSLPFSLSGITVSDGTTTATAATNSTPPTLLKGNPITFSATYRVASNYTPTFLWGLDNVSASQPNPTNTSATTVTYTIPAGTLTVAQHTASFVQATAQLATGGGLVDLTQSATPVNFKVIDCIAPSTATPTSPANGTALGTAPQTVTFQWQAPATGSGPFTYVVKDPSGLVSPYCTTTGSAGVAASCTATLTAAGSYQWAVFTSSQCGTGTSQSTTMGFTIASSGGGGGGGGGGSTSLLITPNPASPNAGSPVTIYINPGTSQLNDSVTVNFGDGSSGTISYDSVLRVGSNSIVHTYAAAGTFTIVASGIAGGVAVAGTKTITVTSNCTLPSAPAASFTFSPAQPRAGQPVSFTDTSTGGPTSWSWNFGDGIPPLIAGHSSTLQNPLNTFSTPGTYTVTLTATNCKGSSATTQQVTVASACSQTAVPTADFTWAPTGALSGFPEQQQPYVGQQITLTDNSSNGPTSWHWYDFNELALNQTVSTPTFTFTWPASLPAGVKNARMTATNCVGTSAEVLHVITIYPDVRHVIADFTWSGGTLATGSPVTLVAAQGPTYGDPDTFAWAFDDGTTATGASITHTFTCAGARTVTLTASRSNYAAATATTSHTLTLTGQQCGPESVMTVDAAQLPGVNATYWRTNVRIFNPSSDTSQITVQFRPLGWGNNTTGATVPVGPNSTLVLDDVIAWGRQQGLFGTDVKKAALRILYDNPANVAPVVTSETYTTPPAGGGTYGQLNPGIDVVPNSTAPMLWITGIRNNGTTTGFRTNYSVLNLRDSAVPNLVFTLLDPTGKALATQAVNLGAYEYRQDSLANLFGGSPAAFSPDPLTVQVAVPDGSDIQAYTSVVDNLTGDPVLIPAVPPPSGAIFLPAVAYTPGVNGTVWRSDMQLTNPDTAPHTWAVTYTPGGQSTLPIVTQKPTLAAQTTVRYDDLLSWLYGGSLTTTSKTSGVVEITPADGSSVYPIVQVRSFNQTASGTFGQNIPPITPDMGVAAGQGERLLLTGMSSQDIARTNLGFVSLSDTSGVNFSVVFYDESGNVLNPKDGQGVPIPYTFALQPDGWDQDKLENRFHNAGFPALPANLRVISAVIQVTNGGPGAVYATVIDNVTGDPNFILAQAAP